MTTNQLIELQKSITAGNWRVSPSGRLVCTADQEQQHVNICLIEDNDNDALAPMPNEVFPNAVAISLVPSLLAEVITLRNALRHCDRLAGCQGNVEDCSFAMGEVRSIARAALANDKE